MQTKDAYQFHAAVVPAVDAADADAAGRDVVGDVHAGAVAVVRAVEFVLGSEYLWGLV